MGRCCQDLLLCVTIGLVWTAHEKVDGHLLWWQIFLHSFRTLRPVLSSLWQKSATNDCIECQKILLLCFLLCKGQQKLVKLFWSSKNVPCPQNCRRYFRKTHCMCGCDYYCDIMRQRKQNNKSCCKWIAVHVIMMSSYTYDVTIKTCNKVVHVSSQSWFSRRHTFSVSGISFWYIRNNAES